MQLVQIPDASSGELIWPLCSNLPVAIQKQRLYSDTLEHELKYTCLYDPRKAHFHALYKLQRYAASHPGGGIIVNTLKNKPLPSASTTGPLVEAFDVSPDVDDVSHLIRDRLHLLSLAVVSLGVMQSGLSDFLQFLFRFTFVGFEGGL